MARRYETLALVVVQDGRIVLEDYAPGITPELRFDTQSMHRGVLALVVGAALADGAIERSTRKPPAGFRNGRRPATRAARSRFAICCMATRGCRSAVREQGRIAGLGMFIGTDLRKVALGMQPQSPPGTTYRATVDRQVLGFALERATGRAYGEYLSARMWKPIGAGDASVQLDRPRR